MPTSPSLLFLLFLLSLIPPTTSPIPPSLNPQIFPKPPYNPIIPPPTIHSPSPEHLTSQGIYIPPSIRPHIKPFPPSADDEANGHIRHLYRFHDAFRVKRWGLPSWGWVGVRSYRGHGEGEWEGFRRRVVGAYWVLGSDEGEGFRVLWVDADGGEDGEDGDGDGKDGDDAVGRRACQKWFLEHSDPPDMKYSLIPTIKKEWSGYETNVCIVADKETIDSVLADTSKNLDETAFLTIVERDFDEEDMKKWAPKLVGRYKGSFKVSPAYLPSLDGRLDEDASYGQMDSASRWFLMGEKTRDGVLREREEVVRGLNLGGDEVVDLGEDSEDEDEGADVSRPRDEL